MDLKMCTVHIVAVEYIWDSTIESIERVQADDPGSGCIIAHCMGLGKTLAVSTLESEH